MRSKLEIMADILSVARNSARKTEIVYKANLNFDRVQRYIDYLKGKGFLEHTGHFYTLTERGEEFLRGYQLMTETLLTQEIRN